MKSQTRYNNKSNLAILKIFIELSNEEEMNYELFNHLTGLSKREYLRTMKKFDEMVSALCLSWKLQSFKRTIIRDDTEYTGFYFKFLPIVDYSFSIKNLSEEQLIKYSDVIVYLMLKNKQYVAYDSLSKKFPNFTRPVFSTMIQDFKEIFGEDIYKDEYQSYIIDEII